jgi:hypothetical protein
MQWSSGKACLEFAQVNWHTCGAFPRPMMSFLNLEVSTGRSDVQDLRQHQVRERGRVATVIVAGRAVGVLLVPNSTQFEMSCIAAKLSPLGGVRTSEAQDVVLREGRSRTAYEYDTIAELAVESLLSDGPPSARVPRCE